MVKKNVYILHSGSELIKEAINASAFREKIISIDPTLSSLLLRAIRKIHLSSNLLSRKVWVDYALNGADLTPKRDSVVVVFDSPIWMLNINYLRNIFRDFKLVFWYWNIIKNETLLKDIVDACDEVYSFDKTNAEYYSIKHHPQFYWRNKMEKVEQDIDVLYIGKNKDRLPLLEKIYSQLEEKNLKPYFYVVRDGRGDKSEKLSLKDNYLEYSKVLSLINRSKSILEINQMGQNGLTLRSLESMFHRKKLISNNIHIKMLDFYQPENVLLFDDDIDITTEYINAPYLDINVDILEKYTFDSWLIEISRDI